MKLIRIIPILLIKDNLLVKGEEFKNHKTLVNNAITTAENLHGRYLGALRNNEYDVAQSIATAIYLNKESESRAYENALSTFKDKSLTNYGNFTSLP